MFSPRLQGGDYTSFPIMNKSRVCVDAPGFLPSQTAPYNFCKNAEIPLDFSPELGYNKQALKNSLV